MIRRILENIYRSPLGRLLSMLAQMLAWFHRPFMVYGYVDPATRQFRKYTRMSSTAVVMNRRSLKIGDHVWVWHHTILDATSGLEIGEGCQIGAWVGIFTHGSESSIRLLGQQYVHIHHSKRKGYTRAPVSIGAYTFIGAGSTVLPGVHIGKGCLIAAGSLVADDVPDFSIFAGHPGKVIGSTILMDLKFFGTDDFSITYYDGDALNSIKNLMELNSTGKN